MDQHAINYGPGYSLPAESWQPVSLVPEINATIDSVASKSFVRAMRGAASGVNVVTTDGTAGRFGLTVSAFSSVSAEPPMVLVCVNRRSPACAAIRQNRAFCVNVLSTSQRDLADTFAGIAASGKPYDFASGSWTRSRTGAPLLNGGVANFDCSLGSAIDAGTHTIFVGIVKAVEHSNASPLLYADRSYRHACRAA